MKAEFGTEERAKIQTLNFPVQQHIAISDSPTLGALDKDTRLGAMVDAQKFIETRIYAVK